MPAPLRNILLFFVFLLSLRLAQVCVHYPWNTIFAPIMNFGSLCRYVIVVGSKLRQACCSSRCQSTRSSVARVDSGTQESCREDTIVYPGLCQFSPYIDEDIATLDTLMPWSSPICNSSPTQLPRSPQIQQTRRHCFGHNFLIRHRNEAFLDALERGWRRHRFGSGPSSKRSVNHSMGKVLHHLFRPTWPCIVLGLKPKLWAPNPWLSPTLGRLLDYKHSRYHC
jgi:hypothetical protein